MLSSKSKSKKSSKESKKDSKKVDPKAAASATTASTPAPASSTPPLASTPSSKDIKDSKSSKKSSKKSDKKTPEPTPAPAPAPEPASSTPAPASSSSTPSPPSSSSEPASSSSPAASSSSTIPTGPAASSSSSTSSDSTSVLKHIAALKARPNLADVDILAAGGRSLFAHECVLQIRCPRLHSILTAGQKKGVKKTFFKHQQIDLLKATKQSISAETLEVVLQFIYGDNIDFNSLAPMLVLQTAVAARALELPRLVRLCHDHLRTVVNMNTVYNFFIYCFNPETKEDTVFSYCLDYAHQNIKDFVNRKAEVASLGMPLFQEIVIAALEEYKPLPMDTSAIPPSTLINDFKTLFTETQSGPGQPDSYVMIGGSKIFFHKALLAAHAEGFHSLAPTATLVDCSQQLIGNSDVSADAFTAMLRYIYYGETNVSPIVGCNLAPYSAKFKLQGLQNICENHIASNIDVDNVLSVLRVAYLPENQDRADMKTLRENGVQFVRNNLKSVDLSGLTQNPIIAVDILQAWKRSL